jgi:hypothetical protein
VGDTHIAVVLTITAEPLVALEEWAGAWIVRPPREQLSVVLGKE